MITSINFKNIDYTKINYNKPGFPASLYDEEKIISLANRDEFPIYLADYLRHIWLYGDTIRLEKRVIVRRYVKNTFYSLKKFYSEQILDKYWERQIVVPVDSEY